MDLQSVKEFLEQQKESAEVKEYLQGFKTLTLDETKNLVTTNEELKKWFDSEKHSHFDKGLQTWMEKTFPTKLDQEIKKRFPEKDPKDIELENIKAQLKQMADEKLYESLKNKALTVATEKKIPTSVIDLLLGKDEESTLTNIGKFEEAINPYIQSQIEERLKSSYQPPGGGNNFTGKNPWKKETFNLTEQAKILNENPELAKQLKAQA
jgi:hypothetical protein